MSNNIKENLVKFILFTRGYNILCPEHFYQSFVNDNNISDDLLADIAIVTRNCDKSERIALIKTLILQNIGILEIQEFAEELLNLYKDVAMHVQENPELLQKPSEEECSEFFNKLLNIKE